MTDGRTAPASTFHYLAHFAFPGGRASLSPNPHSAICDPQLKASATRYGRAPYQIPHSERFDFRLCSMKKEDP
jgi:hypothetical protein